MKFLKLLITGYCGSRVEANACPAALLVTMSLLIGWNESLLRAMKYHFSLVLPCSNAYISWRTCMSGGQASLHMQNVFGLKHSTTQSCNLTIHITPSRFAHQAGSRSVR